MSGKKPKSAPGLLPRNVSFFSDHDNSEIRMVEYFEDKHVLSKVDFKSKNAKAYR